MTHDDFIAQIDRFLDGDLDVIEWHEFRDHMKTCRECSQRLVQRRIDLLDEGGLLAALLEPQPQRCITAGTLTRWLKGEIPMELSPRVSNHLRNCRYCHDHAAELATRLYRHENDVHAAEPPYRIRTAALDGPMGEDDGDQDV